MSERQIRETTKLRVIIALLISHSLSWSELLVRTSLSKNTLSATLKELKTAGELSYVVAETRALEQRPGVLYTLSEIAIRKYTTRSPAVEVLKLVEQLSNEITEGTRLLNEKSSLGKRKLFARYYDYISKASLAVLETAILEWDGSGAPLNEAIVANAISTARRILLLQNQDGEISKELRNELKFDRDRLVKDIQNEAKRLKAKTSRIGL